MPNFEKPAARLVYRARVAPDAVQIMPGTHHLRTRASYAEALLRAIKLGDIETCLAHRAAVGKAGLA